MSFIFMNKDCEFLNFARILKHVEDQISTSWVSKQEATIFTSADVVREIKKVKLGFMEGTSFKNEIVSILKVNVKRIVEIESITADNLIVEPEPIEEYRKVRFCDLPLGARFKYDTNDDDVWVMLQAYDKGKIAKYYNDFSQRQSVCKFVDEDYTLESMVCVTA